MNVSRDFLDRRSADTGFQAATLEKVVHLGALAADISRHPVLGKVLLLKGGTALNLCFGPPHRLSVDLDYNFVGRADREGMLKERPVVEEAMVALGRRSGYEVRRSAEAFANRKLFMTFSSALGVAARIEVDLNFLHRIPLEAAERRKLWQPEGLEQPEVRTVSVSELVIGKMLALLDRGAVRDAWDLAFLPSKAAYILEAPRFRPLFIAMSSILTHPLPSYRRERLARQVTARAVEEQLVPVITGAEIPSASDLVEGAWAVIEKFMGLSPAESEFIEAVSRGILRTELIFPDSPEDTEKTASNPAILWKVANAKKHESEKRR